MGTTESIIVLVSFILCYCFWRAKKNDEENLSEESANNPNANLYDQAREELKKEHMETERRNNPAYLGLNTKELLFAVAKNIGCNIQRDEEDPNRIYLNYQGEHFTVGASEESPFLYIYDVAWYSASLDDIENLSLIRQAVNSCNAEYAATVLYTIDKDENCVNIHTRQCVLFGDYIPSVDEYLRSRLDDSFRQHHNFYQHMEKIRSEQYSY